jgi:O-antigen chain-terminating methyltransferase
LLEQNQTNLANDFKDIKKYTSRVGSLAEQNSHRLNRLDERLTDIVHQLSLALEKGSTTKSTAGRPSDLLADDHSLDHFYVEFEHWFRGSEAEIKKRQKVYLPYFTGSKLDSKQYPVVDIGCGRGEFIGLLKEHGVRAIGLDLNKTMVERALAKKMDAIQTDALSYLRAQPANSLMAVTGFHIVEHIPFSALMHIFDACYRALKPGGFVLFETPNPENLVVGAASFYSDPSHLRPLLPSFLELALKTRGFNTVKIKRLHPIKKNIQHDDPLVKDMAQRLYGPQDYAVIAYKDL